MEITEHSQDALRPEHAIPRIEDSQNRNDKLLPLDSFPQFVRPGEFPKQNDQSINSCKEKLKAKQFLQNRSETVHMIDQKIPSFKRQVELSTPMTSKVPILPLLSIRTNALEEVYKKMKGLKTNITDLEEKTRVNSQCIELGKLKILHLEDQLSRLKGKITVVSSAEKKEELSNKLKNLQVSWKKSTSALKQQIIDLEEQVKNLIGRTESMRGLLCQNTLKNKSMRKRLNINGSNSENDYNSPELLNSSSRFRLLIQTPSLSTLFH